MSSSGIRQTNPLEARLEGTTGDNYCLDHCLDYCLDYCLDPSGVVATGGRPRGETPRDMKFPANPEGRRGAMRLGVGVPARSVKGRQPAVPGRRLDHRSQAMAPCTVSAQPQRARRRFDRLPAGC